MDIYDQILDGEPLDIQPADTSAVKKPDVYDAVLDAQDAQQQRQLQNTLELASKNNADKTAQALNLSKTTGLPLDLVERNLPAVAQKQQLQTLAAQASRHPVLKRQLQDPVFAKLAHDDIENLSATASAFGYMKNAGSAMASGVFGFTEGLTGTAEAGADFVRRTVTTPLADAGVLPADIGGPISELLQSIRKSQADWRQYLMPKARGAVEQGVYSGLQSLTSNLLMAPAAVMTGNPALMLNTMAATTGGQSYGKAKDAGVGFERSLVYGASDAVVEKATEMLPVGQLFADLKAGTPFFKTLLNQLATEIPQEQIATLAQDFNEWAVLQPDKTFGDYVSERPNAALQTLIATAIGTGGMVSVMKGADAVLNRQDKAQRALMAQGRLEALREYSQASKVAKRDASLYQSFIDQLAENAGDHVYIDPAQIVQTGLAGQLFQAVPELEAAFNQASQTGTELSIRTSDFLTRIGNQDWVGPLLDHVRQEDEEYSPASAKTFLAQIPDETAQQFEAALAQQASEQQTARESAQIEDYVYQQLNQLGRHAANVNRHYANLVGRYYEVQSQRFGLSPQKLYEQFPLVVQSELAGPAFRQTTSNAQPEAQPMPAEFYATVNIDVADGQGQTAQMSAAALKTLTQDKINAYQQLINCIEAA